MTDENSVATVSVELSRSVNLFITDPKCGSSVDITPSLNATFFGESALFLGDSLVTTSSAENVVSINMPKR